MRTEDGPVRGISYKDGQRTSGQVESKCGFRGQLSLGWVLDAEPGEGTYKQLICLRGDARGLGLGGYGD